MGTKLVEFTVLGRGEFPLDMLRYDQCWPKRESVDVIAIGRTFDRRHARDAHDITLVGLRQPTAARWKSFGWEVQ